MKTSDLSGRLYSLFILATSAPYERDFISSWNARRIRHVFDYRRSPKTNELLAHTSLTPNRTVKSMITDFLEERRKLQVAINDG